MQSCWLVADFSVYIEQLKGLHEAQFHLSHVTHKKDKIFFNLSHRHGTYGFLQINLHIFFLLIFLAMFHLYIYPSNVSLVSGASNNGMAHLFTPCSLKLTPPDGFLSLCVCYYTDGAPGLLFPVSSVLSIYDTNEETLYKLLGHPRSVLG